MDVYPFFLECSKYEIGSRRKQLQQLAIGCGGYVVNGSTLMFNEEKFKIPSTFSEHDRSLLMNMLWPDTMDFYKLQNIIKTSNGVWKNLRKKDRLRLIDAYVLKKPNMTKREKIYLKANITMSIILKILSNKQIEYYDFEVIDIVGLNDLATTCNTKLLSIASSSLSSLSI